MSSKFTSNLLQFVTKKHKNFFSTSNTYKNHYDVLKLAPNCSSKDIKDSFIKLSKENHPDVNKSKSAHSQFLQINEAYKVLSKPQSRHIYDLGLSNNVTNLKNCINVEYRSNDPWSDPTFYHNRVKSENIKNSGNHPYYGIKGLKKVSNTTIAFLCVVFALFAGTIQFVVIRHVFLHNREVLLNKSADAQAILNQIRQEANENGNELQIKLLKLKLKIDDKEK